MGQNQTNVLVSDGRLRLRRIRTFFVVWFCGLFGHQRGFRRVRSDQRRVRDVAVDERARPAARDLPTVDRFRKCVVSEKRVFGPLSERAEDRQKRSLSVNLAIENVTTGGFNWQERRGGKADSLSEKSFKTACWSGREESVIPFCGRFCQHVLRQNPPLGPAAATVQGSSLALGGDRQSVDLAWRTRASEKKAAPGIGSGGRGCHGFGSAVPIRLRDELIEQAEQVGKPTRRRRRALRLLILHAGGEVRLRNLRRSRGRGRGGRSHARSRGRAGRSRRGIHRSRRDTADRSTAARFAAAIDDLVTAVAKGRLRVMADAAIAVSQSAGEGGHHFPAAAARIAVQRHADLLGRLAADVLVGIVQGIDHGEKDLGIALAVVVRQACERRGPVDGRSRPSATHRSIPRPRRDSHSRPSRSCSASRSKHPCRDRRRLPPTNQAGRCCSSEPGSKSEPEPGSRYGKPEPGSRRSEPGSTLASRSGTASMAGRSRAAGIGAQHGPGSRRSEPGSTSEHSTGPAHSSAGPRSTSGPGSSRPEPGSRRSEPGSTWERSAEPAHGSAGPRSTSERERDRARQRGASQHRGAQAGAGQPQVGAGQHLGAQHGAGAQQRGLAALRSTAGAAHSAGPRSTSEHKPGPGSRRSEPGSTSGAQHGAAAAGGGSTALGSFTATIAARRFRGTRIAADNSEQLGQQGRTMTGLQQHSSAHGRSRSICLTRPCSNRGTGQTCQPVRQWSDRGS